MRALAGTGFFLVTMLCPASTFALTIIHDCTGLQAIDVNTPDDYVLSNDIDCTGVDFTPIGTYSSMFTSIFNGNGHTISNLTIDSNTGAALFAFTNGATIQNVVLDNASVTVHGSAGESGAGGIVGYGISTSLSNVGVTNSTIMRSGSYVGGIAGLFLGSMTGAYVTNTTVNGTDEGVGGLVGALAGGYIHDSYAIADVSADTGGGGAVGELIAFASAGLQNVYASGSVVNVGNYAGGLVGAMATYGGGCSIQNSFAGGAVSGPAAASLVAYKQDAACSIVNSYVLDHANNPDDCIGINGGGTTECTEVPVGFSYYFQFSGVPPMSSWDFTDTWTERYLHAPGLQWVNARPGPVTSLTATATANDVLVSWTNPVESDLNAVVLLRSTSSYPVSANQTGIERTSVVGTSHTDSDLPDGTYYYGAFAVDNADTLSLIAQTSVTVPGASASSSSSSAPAATSSSAPAVVHSGGGRRGSPGRGSTAEALNGPRSINQPHTAAPMTPAEPARETMTASLQSRTCERVMKWLKNDAVMLGRVNARLEKRFGFRCDQ